MTAITRRTAEVPIFQGDDLAKIEEAEAKFVRAEQLRKAGKGGRLNPDTTPAREAAIEFDAIVEDALTRAVTAKVQAIGRKYRHLLAEHPPRPNVETDEAQGYDESTFLDAVAEFWDLKTGERTILEPHFDSQDALVAWLDGLSDGQFHELVTAAIRVNIGGQPDPKVLLASRADQTYSEISESPSSTE